MLRVSVCLPTLGDRELLRLLLWSVKQTTRPEVEVEVCIGSHVPFPDIPTYNVPLKVKELHGVPGVAEGTNAAFDMADGDYVVIGNDDMVFLQSSFDEFDQRVAPDRITGWILLEPRNGSYPPICDAGKTPETFNWELANRSATERKLPTSVPGEYFGFVLVHRSLITEKVRFDPGLGAYGGQDADFFRQLYTHYPDLLYGNLGLCVYHFQRATIDKRPDLSVPGEQVMSNFIKKWDLPIGDSYAEIYARSQELVRNSPLRWRT